jgi:hypothetical protein
MQKFIGFTALTIMGAVSVGVTQAGTENVLFPTGYADKFVQYHTIDKTSKKRGPTHRIFLINRDALAAVKAGKPLPSGTVLVREDWFVKTDSKKSAIKDAQGRFIKTNKKLAFVMEKRDGWGADYPASKRNGNWEYAAFKIDGTRHGKIKTGGCFGCHMRKKCADFVFSMKELIPASIN